AHVRIRVPLGHVMDDLSDSPPPRSIGHFQLRLAQASRQFTESRGQLFDCHEMFFARRNVDWRRHAFEAAHRITQGFKVSHRRLLLIESRREASLCYEYP